MNELATDVRAKTVLFVTNAIPYSPNKSGAVTYSRGVIEMVAGHFSVIVVAPKSAACPPESPAVTWRTPVSKARPKWSSLLSVLPHIANQHCDKRILSEVLTSASQVDLVIVDHLAMSWVVAPLRSALQDKCPPIVMINHNLEGALRGGIGRATARLTLKIFAALDGMKARRLERTVSVSVDGLTAITETDLVEFNKIAPGVPSLLLFPTHSGNRRSARTITGATPKRIAVIGGRGPSYKQLVLLRILEEFSRIKIPNDVIVDVVGHVGSKMAKSVCRQFPRINFVGYVENLADYMDGVRLGVIPDEIGGGFKVRALDHVFQRVPMICVRKSMDGMGLRGGIDYIHAEDLPSLAAKSISLIDDLDSLNEIQSMAYDRYAVLFNSPEQSRSLASWLNGLIDLK